MAGVGDLTTMTFSEAVKREALDRARNICECAGCDRHDSCYLLFLGSGLTTHFDHINPKALGGSDTLENCRVLCVPCHRATPTYGLTLEEILEAIPPPVPAIPRPIRMSDGGQAVIRRKIRFPRS